MAVRAAAGSALTRIRRASTRAASPPASSTFRASSIRPGSSSPVQGLQGLGAVRRRWNSDRLTTAESSGPASFMTSELAARMAAWRSVAGAEASRLQLRPQRLAAGPAGRGASGRQSPMTLSRPDGLAHSPSISSAWARIASG